MRCPASSTADSYEHQPNPGATDLSDQAEVAYAHVAAFARAFPAARVEAADEETNLIVIPSHGRSATESILLGSVAERVLHLPGPLSRVRPGTWIAFCTVTKHDQSNRRTKTMAKSSGNGGNNRMGGKNKVVHTEPSAEEIAQLAYEKFEQRGCGHGSDLDDWFDAQKDLMSRGGRQRQ